ncbi:hypothetical protein BC936DRAFT_143205 [Jimgerdemannia flammicorona]|uniref:ER membrane protein complex subunit 2 n=1 Tax=Jimgerdemannia flammicorona TaxID=994334 RepID=A0A433DMG0_9FUNG|nr:hypothetical protein BC936DRAFT_143205 [Jimgerdemannia flammicorona]
MSSFNFNAAVTTLQELRASGERNPELVVSLGNKIVRGKYTGGLGDEVWPVYEQIIIAALDVGDFQLADTCLTALEKRFTRSTRVQRLLGMRYEAEGKLDQAAKIYEEILDVDETNVPAAKRQIAILNTRGETHEAIAALTRYLDTSYNDPESWLELCSLYLSQRMYQQAAFCMEEVLLLQGSNHVWHLKYAEILYTMAEHKLALKEFCRVIELCEDHVRGLYGVQLCTSQLLKTAPTVDLSDLNALATERILAVYSARGAPDELKRVVRRYLESA